jgi:hypothetical protein
MEKGKWGSRTGGAVAGLLAGQSLDGRRVRRRGGVECGRCFGSILAVMNAMYDQLPDLNDRKFDFL